MSTYDTWRLNPPEAYDPDPCECGETGCTCAEDEANERGDALYHAQKERRNENRH